MTPTVLVRRMMSSCAVLVIGFLIATGCGSDDDRDGAGTSSGASVVSSSATTGTTTSSSSETSSFNEQSTTSASPSSKASASSGKSSTSAPARPTAADLEQALEAEIEAVYPYVGPGVVDCAATGQLTDWQPILCFFLPDEPAEFGGIHVSMLDDGRYAWDLGPCCAARPWPDDYQSGLFCRDLVEPPPDSNYLPESDHLTYGLAVFYWLTEGRPDRMDADLNGRPCETVYPAGEVADFWDSARAL